MELEYSRPTEIGTQRQAWFTARVDEEMGAGIGERPITLATTWLPISLLAMLWGILKCLTAVGYELEAGDD